MSIANDNPALPLLLPPLSCFTAPISGAVDYDETSRSWLVENGLDGLKKNFNYEVNVAFLNGTANQKEKVIKYAKDWLICAPAIKLRFVKGIHGHIRVAFDDEVGKDIDNDSDDEMTNEGVAVKTKIVGKTAVREISWSHVGRYSLNAISTPETMHLGQIDDSPLPALINPDDSDYPIPILADPSNAKQVRERRVIHHMFGHALGLRFAKPKPPLDWTDNTATVAQKNLNWPSSGVKDVINRDDNIEPSLPEKSVMAFGWRYDLSFDDMIAISELYPIQAKFIRFSIQDFFEKSLTHQQDLDIYVLDRDGRIFLNRRSSKKTAPKVKGIQKWSFWSRVIKGVPTDAKDLAILDLTDRLEIIVIDGNNTLKFNWRPKNTKKWKGWQGDKSNAKKIKILQIQDGYEVFIQTTEGKLEHFTRRTGDLEIPKQMHPLPGQNIRTIHAARVGPATNPIQIYAASGLDVCAASLATPAFTWSLSTLAIDKVSALDIKKIEFATVGDSRHAFIIDDKNRLHYNRSNDQGWFSWNPVVLHPDADKEILTVAAGVVASNDKEDDYMHVFVRDKKSQVFYNRVDVDGLWGWPNDKGELDSAWRKGIPQPGKPDDLFPLAEDVQTKRAKSGDLEVFIITAASEKYPYRLLRNRIDADGWITHERRHIWWK